TRDLRDENLAAYPRTREAVGDQLCEYYGLITHLDEQVGRILSALAASPHGDNTVVIYAADHGLALGSHGLLGKQSVYEHSMRCPLIVAGPGIPHGTTAAFTYLFDIHPTLLDLAGVVRPDGLAGENLRPIWTGQRESVRDSIFLPFTDTMRAVRDRRWKLIVYPKIARRQLFDLETDPGEMNDLSEDPRFEEPLQDLLQRMATWQSRVGDRQPLQGPTPASGVLNLEGYQRKPDPWQPAWIVEKYF
ncbi:MAG: sulfatase-like hydrolase/transferase, partial [Verrucomicrobia bacterium]|nr:sulfatase-like hydrolase/transferase [Verrucomicrobiota bacterium]